MPIYEFRCSGCESSFEEFFHSSTYSKGNVICPDCGSNDITKLLSVFAADVSESPADFNPGQCGTGSCSSGMCGMN